MTEEQIMQYAITNYPPGTHYRCPARIRVDSVVDGEIKWWIPGVSIDIIGQGFIYYEGEWAEIISLPEPVIGEVLLPYTSVDDVRNVMSETSTPKPIKKKRTRAPKVIAPFSIVETQKERKVFSANNFHITKIGNEEVDEDSELIICPYSSLIPLDYLFAWDRNVGNNSYWAMPYSIMRKVFSPDRGKMIEERDRLFDNPTSIGNMFITNCQSRSCEVDSKESWVEKVKISMTNYMKFDSLVNIEKYRGYARFSGRGEFIKSRFVGSHLDLSHSFSLRSYYGTVGFLTTYIGASGGYRKPSIMAVMRPEDYLYQKHHLFVHGSIDLTKVIVLVDRELDSKYYPIKPYRALYRKELEPFILSTACQVIKVPVSFMLDNCFLGKFKLRGKTRAERAEAKESLIKAFYKDYGHEPTASPAWTGSQGALNTDTGQWTSIDGQTTPPYGNTVNESPYTFTIQTGAAGAELLNNAFANDFANAFPSVTSATVTTSADYSGTSTYIINTNGENLSYQVEINAGNE